MEISGYKLITNTNLLDRVFYRKQTRKFKNKRWNKKYLKKHSGLIPSKKFYVDIESKMIIGHPVAIDQLIKVGTYSPNPVNYRKPLFKEPFMEKPSFDSYNASRRTWGNFGIKINQKNSFFNLNCVS